MLIVLCIALPIAELLVIVKVSELIGVAPTLALLLAGSILGVILLRHQGRGAWRRFNLALAERRFPGREVADGLMIAAGASLLLIPGFITDVFGLILLIPPTRAIARRLLRAYFGRRFVVVGMTDRTTQRRGEDDGTRAYDFEATAEEVGPDERQLPR
ncbi:MAG: FxsA family protein [Solirubrobacterales bacterium]